MVLDKRLHRIAFRFGTARPSTTITTDKTGLLKVLFCRAFGLETKIASVEHRIAPAERQIRLYTSFCPLDESGTPLYGKLLSTTTSFSRMRLMDAVAMAVVRSGPPTNGVEKGASAGLTTGE
ncbi:hypothetical protein CBL_09190 [Carabus blaptoides fortunei]